MLNIEKTLENFGYSPSQLSRGSKKPIIVKCDYCGDDSTVINKNYSISLDKNRRVGIEKDCCTKCRVYKSIEIQEKKGTRDSILQNSLEKKRKTCLQKYGTEYPSQAMEIKNKVADTWKSKAPEELNDIKQRQLQGKIEKYGSLEEYTKIRNENFEKTMIERHGVKHPLQNQNIKRKQQETMLSKYGNDNIFKTEKFQENLKEKNLKEYSVEHTSQREDVKAKIIQSNLEKYGVKCPLQSPEIQAKSKQTNLLKYGDEHPSRNIKVKNKTQETSIENGVTQVYGGKTVSEWAAYKELSIVHTRRLLQEYGHKFVERFSKRNTALEQIIKEMLDKNNIQYEDRKKIGPFFYDFKINNLIIEADGLFWHSDFNNKPRQYHKKKMEFYLENGLIPLFFRSDEIENKLPIIESIVLNKLNRSKKIYARKCEIIELEKTSFFHDNHLMGIGVGKIIALKNNDEIVAAIQIKKVKDLNYEVSRFATKIGVNVIGGFSRLISYFEKHTKAESLKTFIDLRYGRGVYLKDLGFEYCGSYLSFKWTDGRKTFHRMQYPGNSGLEHGLAKIWDCGQAKYIKKYKK